MVQSTEGAASRYMDLTPYPGLPSPIVISSWGFQLKLSSPADPRLQQFVNKFRASPAYTPNTAARAPEGSAPRCRSNGVTAGGTVRSG